MNGQSAEKDFSFLLGLYLGDGHIEKKSDNNYNFSIESIDKEFIEYTASVLSRVAGKEVKTREVSRLTKAGNKVYATSLGDIYFKKIYEDTCRKSFIPDYVKYWDKESKLVMLQAIIDSDGYISCRNNGDNWKFQMGYTSTYSWILDVKQLLEDVGIRTKKLISHTPKAPRKQYHAFGLVVKSVVESGFNFIIKRKQMKLDLYKEKHYKDGVYHRFTHKIYKTRNRNSQRLHAKAE